MGSTRHLPVGQPAGRVGPEGDVFAGVVVGGVPTVLVDFAADLDRVGFGVDAGAEGVWRLADGAVGCGVADPPAFGWQLFGVHI